MVVTPLSADPDWVIKRTDGTNLILLENFKNALPFNPIMVSETFASFPVAGWNDALGKMKLAPISNKILLVTSSNIPGFSPICEADVLVEFP